MSVSSLKAIYYAFFHSIMSYGIIFWGKLSRSSIIFRIQKKAIRIVEGCGNRVSCRNLFKKLEILPLTSQYVLSLLMFVVQNKNLFLTNNENHNLDTRQRNNLYLPQENLTIYQKGAYYSGIKIFNNLPLEVKNVAVKQKESLKLLWKNFYTLTHFTQLVNRELRTVSQDFIIMVCDLRFYVHYVNTLDSFF